MKAISPIAGAIALILLAMGLILYSNAPSHAVDDKVQAAFDSVVDETGKISLPAEDYRSNWHLLGSWSIAGSEEKAFTTSTRNPASLKPSKTQESFLTARFY